MLGSSGSFLVLVNKETTWLAWDAGKRKARRLRELTSAAVPL